jgi:hypothetical protein
MNTTTTVREALPQTVVEAARKSLVISLEDAQVAINGHNPTLLADLANAVALAETDHNLRAALNRILYTSRNTTFSYSCREKLAEYKATHTL